jgi:hypothetical protein
MVSVKSSAVMRGSACWIGAAGWGRWGLVSSRSRARSRERAGSPAGFAVMDAMLPYQAVVLLPIASLAGRNGPVRGRGIPGVSVPDAGQAGEIVGTEIAGPAAYKQRNTVARAFCQLRQYRAVATRYDKRDFVWRGTIDVASIRLHHPVPSSWRHALSGYWGGDW